MTEITTSSSISVNALRVAAEGPRSLADALMR